MAAEIQALAFSSLGFNLNLKQVTPLVFNWTAVGKARIFQGEKNVFAMQVSLARERYSAM